MEDIHHASSCIARLFDESTPHPSPLDPPSSRFDDTLTLLAHANQQGQLQIEGPWRLSGKQVRHLTRTSGRVPQGGWTGLMALLAGTDLFCVEHDDIKAKIDLVDFYQNWDDQRLQTALIEALTCRLVPPSIAAGLFLLVGIHPAWGMKIAHDIHAELGLFGREEVTVGDAVRFPHATEVAKVIFGTLAALCEVLTLLKPYQAYDLDTFSQFVWHACRYASATISKLPYIEGQMETHFGLLDPSHDPLGRAWDFTCSDLFEQFFEPTGIAQRVNAQQFVVWPERMPVGVRFSHHGTLKESENLLGVLMHADFLRVA